MYIYGCVYNILQTCELGAQIIHELDRKKKRRFTPTSSRFFRERVIIAQPRLDHARVPCLPPCTFPML